MDFFRTQSFLEAARDAESIQVVYLRKHPFEELSLHYLSMVADTASFSGNVQVPATLWIGRRVDTVRVASNSSTCSTNQTVSVFKQLSREPPTCFKHTDIQQHIPCLSRVFTSYAVSHVSACCSLVLQPDDLPTYGVEYDTRLDVSHALAALPVAHRFDFSSFFSWILIFLSNRSINRCST